MGIVFPCQPLPSECCWKFPHDIGLGELKIGGSESRNFHIRYAMCFWRSRMVTWPSWLIAPLFHSGQSFQTVKTKSMMVCVTNQIYSKFNFEKKKQMDRNGAWNSHYCGHRLVNWLLYILLRLAITPYWP